MPKPHSRHLSLGSYATFDGWMSTGWKVLHQRLRLKLFSGNLLFWGGGIEMKRNDMITYDICFLKFFMNLFDIV